jgi:PIN domain nuclease of toxin-antitoxin system
LRVLLDTVTFIWAITTPQRLSRNAMALVEREDTLRELSVISVSEIAIKQMLKKLDLDKQAVLAAVDDLKVRYLPYTVMHAYQMFGLPLHHSDPFDRQIIAQALGEGIPVLTSDVKFKLYKGLKVIW